MEKSDNAEANNKYIPKSGKTLVFSLYMNVNKLYDYGMSCHTLYYNALDDATEDYIL